MANKNELTVGAAVMLLSNITTGICGSSDVATLPAGLRGTVTKNDDFVLVVDFSDDASKQGLIGCDFTNVHTLPARVVAL